MMDLINRGYTKGENPNEWYRGNWIIRYIKEEIEFYENTEKNGLAKYYHGKLNEVDIELILDEIDELEMN